MNKFLVSSLMVLTLGFVSLEARNGFGVGLGTGVVGGLILGKATSDSGRSSRRDNKDLRRDVRSLENENDYLRRENEELREMVRELKREIPAK